MDDAVSNEFVVVGGGLGDRFWFKNEITRTPYGPIVFCTNNPKPRF